MIILKTKNLIKHFGGVYAVRNLDLKIEGGRITALVGPNGSGKSTLVNLLSGVLPFDEGVVVIHGVTLKKIVPRENPLHGVTRTFQNVRLFEQMSVEDNVLVVLTERNVFGALFERHSSLHLARAETVLRRVGLWEKRQSRANALSYGQRKLLEIARVLAMAHSTGSTPQSNSGQASSPQASSGQAAEIYLFDEPFAGLFPEMAKIISGVLRELREKGKTIVLVEHDMGLIRELADHCIVMDSGELLAEGKPREVLAKPEVVEAYLGK